MPVDLDLGSGAVRSELKRPLLRAYGKYLGLKEMVERHLEDFTQVPLGQIASDRMPQAEVVDALIESARDQGYGLELLLAAIAERPRNPDVLGFTSEAVLRGWLKETGIEPDSRRADV